MFKLFIASCFALICACALAQNDDNFLVRDGDSDFGTTKALSTVTINDAGTEVAIGPNLKLDGTVTISPFTANGLVHNDTNGLLSSSLLSRDDLDARMYNLTEIYNGFVFPQYDVNVSSNGTTITLTVERNGGGDLTAIFSDGFHEWDTTPKDSIALIEGTDQIATVNFIYFLQSTKLLTVSTTGWPATEHVPVADVFCQSAATMAIDGPLKVHVWNEHINHDNNQGHMYSYGFWIRSQHATWLDGIAPTTTVGAGIFDVAVSSGTILQLHPHVFPALSTAGGDDIFVVNDTVNAYKRVPDLTNELTDSLGNSMAGKFFNLVLWAVVSEKTGDCKYAVNLPNGSYNNSQTAQNDDNNTADYTVPASFKGAGFLIARLTMRHQNAAGGTWSEILVSDLRGLVPATAQGSSAVGRDDFADSNFTIFNNVDNTKIAAFDASGISAATTRTFTFPDANGTLALTSDIGNHVEKTGDTMSGLLDIDVAVTGLDVNNNESTPTGDTFASVFGVGGHSTGISIGSNGTESALIQAGASDSLTLEAGAGSVGGLTLGAAGNVGIDNTSPGTDLAIGIAGLELMADSGLHRAAEDALDLTSDGGIVLQMDADNDSTNTLTIKDGAGNVLFTVEEGGDIGVGTTNPIQLLHVQGIVPRIHLKDTNTAGNPIFEILDDDQTWTMRVANNDLIFRDASGGADILALDSATDFVGIKDTSPSFNLDVNGTGRFVGDLRLDAKFLGSVRERVATGSGLTASGFLSIGGVLMSHPDPGQDHGIHMNESGSITRISLTVHATSISVAGTITVLVLKNNSSVLTATTASVASTAIVYSADTEQARGVDTFSDGDDFTIKITFDGSAAMTIDVIATVEYYYDN